MVTMTGQFRNYALKKTKPTASVEPAEAAGRRHRRRRRRATVEAAVAEAAVVETLVTPIPHHLVVVNQIVGWMAAPVGLTMVMMEGQTHVQAPVDIIPRKLIVVAKPA
jgi:hypothetical protein